LRRALAALAAAVALIVLAPATASAAKVPGDFYGVVSQGTMSPYDAFLMNQAGVDTLRFHLDWRHYQREPGRCQAAAADGICDWRELDYAFGLMAAAGIRPFPFLLNVPSFISEQSNTPPIRSKAHRRAWITFVQAAVRRYGRGGEYWKRQFPDQFPGSRAKPVTHWEVWNEPSDGSYWEPKPDPVEYARLLEITGRAIHKEKKGADVVFAGLFGTPTEDNNGIKSFKYYRKAFAQPKIGRYFDDVGVHPYGPTLKRLNVQMDWVLEEMRTAGLRNRDIWVTEIAWSSAEPPTILGVGPEGQARMLTESFKLFRRHQRDWNVEGLHWYAYSDLPPGYPLCEFCEKAGLVDFDRNPKPSYYAFQAIAGR
jgi:hypothetical protein